MGRRGFGRKRKAGTGSARGRTLCDRRRRGPGRGRQNHSPCPQRWRFCPAVSERLHACALRACRESKGRNAERTQYPCYGRALFVTFLTISATAPAKGWKVKCTTCRPRGQTTARK